MGEERRCPTCRAEPGKHCRTSEGRPLYSGVHNARYGNPPTKGNMLRPPRPHLRRAVPPLNFPDDAD